MTILVLAMHSWNWTKSIHCYFATVLNSFWCYQWSHALFPRSAEVAWLTVSLCWILMSLMLWIVILSLVEGSNAELPALIFPPVEMLTLFNCYRLLIKGLFEATPRESSCVIEWIGFFFPSISVLAIPWTKHVYLAMPTVAAVGGKFCFNCT